MPVYARFGASEKVSLHCDKSKGKDMPAEKGKGKSLPPWMKGKKKGKGK